MLQNSKYAKMYIAKGFLDGTEDENPPANAGDMDSIPGPGKFHTPWSSKACVPQVWGPHSSAFELLYSGQRTHTLQQAEPPPGEAHAPQLERSPTQPS